MRICCGIGARGAMGQAMSETDLSRSIRKELSAIGIPCERVQSGMVHVKGYAIHLAGKGTPDIVTPFGWLEIKLPGEQPNPDQLLWHEKWRKLGARIAVVRSVSEAVSTVREWQRQSAMDTVQL